MMRTIKTAYERFGAIPLCLGRQGETGIMEVRIDISTPLEEYPGAWFALEAENPEGVCYPVVSETDGDTLIWPITGADTAKSGRGRAQVVMYGEEGEIGRSKPIDTAILPSLTVNGDAPDPVQNWIDNALKLLEELKNYELPVEQIEQIIEDFLEENPPEGSGVDEEQLKEALNEAFEEAKKSGEFDGAPGKDGGYYTPVMEGSVLKRWKPSNDDMFVVEQNIDLKGKPGKDGADGGYYVPVMIGTVLDRWVPSENDMYVIYQGTDLRGPAGSDATVTSANIASALGYTPANAETVSQLSADKSDKLIGIEHAGKLLYVAADGKITPLTLGAGLAIVDGVLTITSAPVTAAICGQAVCGKTICGG